MPTTGTKTDLDYRQYPEGMDSRELMYFVAVAEERNFTRAADRLGIAQPALSRAIQRLERSLDTRLLRRGSRETTLTPAGRVLLEEGRKTLTALATAERLTRHAGQGKPRLTVVTKPGGDAGLLASLLMRFADRPDAVEVDVLICGIGEETALLRDGIADVALLRLPQEDLSGLDGEELLTEREMLVVAPAHRLAGRASASMADLVGETFPRWTAKSPGNGPVISDTGQVAELISLGLMIAVLPESVASRLHHDLVSIPIDGRQTTLLAVWSQERRERSLAAFIRTAAEIAATHQCPARPLTH